jgi:soluble lytic murein transglycosylase-like protein
MNVKSLLSAALAGIVGAELAMLSIPGQWRHLHELVGKEEGVDPNLLHAFQLRENLKGDPAAVNTNRNAAGVALSSDHGLMQINTTNYAALHLTPETVTDPATNIRAAAKLIKSNMTVAPHLGILSQIAAYNTGFSAHRDDLGRLRPKLTADGSFSNQPYVMGVATWYLLITIASIAPVKTLGWKATA